MKLTIFYSILISSLLANAEVKLDFKVNNNPLTIYKYENVRVSSSLKCGKLDQGLFCDELKFLNDLKNYKLKKEISDGITYGSAICNEKLEGIIVMATTSVGGQNAFCKMKNGIYVELGTLGYYFNLK